MRGLEAAVWKVLDRRLRPSGPPVGVALSGGGDSLALTLIADGWARQRGRELVVFTVDHRLRPESVEWSTRCERLAARLGRPFRAPAWEGEKPATGLPAAARDARHRLLAEEARAAGAQVILMGHTADDVAEAQMMRAAGSTTPAPREWAPSPVWPEGRGVFVLRPLLSRRRAELRGWLSAHGEDWIDDPANADLRFARSRARAAGAGAGGVEDVGVGGPLELAGEAEHEWGAIRIRRGALAHSPLEEVIRFLGLACVCAGGGERRPATDRMVRLAEALRGEEPIVATLAGSRLRADAICTSIVREPGEFRRRGASPQPLPGEQEVVWDGRFAAAAHRPGLALGPVAGVAARLPRQDRAFLVALPADLRGGLPAVLQAGGGVRLAVHPDLAEDLTVRPLVRARFEAAAGLVQREPAAST